MFDNVKYVLSYIWNDKVLRYLLGASLIIVILIVVSVTSSSAESSLKGIYYISKNVKVLAFYGDPHSLNVTPLRLTSSERQKIRLFHKKSGPGIYAFYIEGFKYKTDDDYEVVREKGYFLISRRKVMRVSKY